MTLTSLLKFVFTYYKKNISIFFSLIVIIIISSYLITSYYNKNKILINYSIDYEIKKLNIPNKYINYIFEYLSRGFINEINEKNFQFIKINNATIQVYEDFDISILESSEIQFNLSIVLNKIVDRKEAILKKLLSTNENADYKNEILEIIYLREIININNFLKFNVYYEKPFKFSKLIFTLLCIFSTIFIAPFILVNLRKILK